MSVSFNWICVYSIEIAKVLYCILMFFFFSWLLAVLAQHLFADYFQSIDRSWKWSEIFENCNWYSYAREIRNRMQSLSWNALWYVKLSNLTILLLVFLIYIYIKKKICINILTLYVNVNIEHHCVKWFLSTEWVL